MGLESFGKVNTGVLANPTAGTVTSVSGIWASTSLEPVDVVTKIFFGMVLTLSIIALIICIAYFIKLRKPRNAY